MSEKRTLKTNALVKPSQVQDGAADVASAGGGTLLALVANHFLPDQFKWLIAFAPCISIGMRRISAWVFVSFERYREKREWMAAIKRAQDTVQAALERARRNPATPASVAHVERLTKESADLDILLCHFEVENLKSLRR